MPNMTGPEIDEFLAQPLKAQLVILRPSGMPHLVPVWYLWVGGRALVAAVNDSVKVRNIRLNSAVALCVGTAGRLHSFVSIEGTAALNADGVEPIIHQICARYDGPVRGPEYALELLEGFSMTLIEIASDRFITWRDDA